MSDRETDLPRTVMYCALLFALGMVVVLIQRRVNFGWFMRSGLTVKVDALEDRVNSVEAGVADVKQRVEQLDAQVAAIMSCGSGG